MPPENEIEEIDVDQLIERIATLEKENLSLKNENSDFKKRLESCEVSIDKLAEYCGAN